LSFSFPKLLRVRTRRQYQRIAQQSKRHVGYWVIIEARQNKHTSTKLGITASRHYGIAVERNRFKRIG
jgi:ribonuclease P protein component